MYDDLCDSGIAQHLTTVKGIKIYMFHFYDRIRCSSAIQTDFPVFDKINQLKELITTREPEFVICLETLLRNST